MKPLHWGSALFREGGGASKVLQYQATQGPQITGTTVWSRGATTRGGCREGQSRKKEDLRSAGV